MPQVAVSTCRGHEGFSIFRLASSSQPPVLASRPPSGLGWVHEIKNDGYRMIVRRDGLTVRLYGRNAYDWTARRAALAATVELIKSTASAFATSARDWAMVSCAADTSSWVLQRKRKAMCLWRTKFAAASALNLLGLGHVPLQAGAQSFRSHLRGRPTLAGPGDENQSSSGRVRRPRATG
jgi:hypothetical protein